MPGRSTTDAVFNFRQMLKKNEVKQSELYLILIYLEKAYDTVPGEKVRKITRMRGMTEKYRSEPKCV